MAPDQPEPAHTAAPAIQVLIVDPDALRSAARRLDDLPAPDSPPAEPPSAAEVGQRGLAEEIAEFDQRFRAVESALLADTEDATAQLTAAAERYRRADDETASQLIELQDALSRRPDPDDTDETDDHDRDRDDGDRDDRNRDDHDRDRRTVYEV
jgi:hypothetical protein